MNQKRKSIGKAGPKPELNTQAIKEKLMEMAKPPNLSGLLVKRESDPVDTAVSDNERELSVSQLRILSPKAVKAREALKRIKDGTYGVCLNCGEQINPKRLQPDVAPEAEYCVPCQEFEETHGSLDDYKASTIFPSESSEDDGDRTPA